MKKTLATLLTLLLLVSLSASCFAAGKLSVTEEDFIVTNSYGVYAYCYAKVQNVGDKPIKVNAGILELFDQAGENITSTDYLYAYPEYLQPDEYAYVRMSTSVDAVQEPSEIDDYMLTITGKSDMDKTSLRLPCTSDYQENVSTGYWAEDYMYGTVTNNTDAIIYNIDILLVLLDDEGHILYMEDDTLYNEGLMPGSSITFRAEVSSSFKDYFEAKGLTPTHVEAVAYVDIEN